MLISSTVLVSSLSFHKDLDSLQRLSLASRVKKDKFCHGSRKLENVFALPTQPLDAGIEGNKSD